MADLFPARMQARTVLRQLVNDVGAIYPPQFYLPSLPEFDASERTLVGKWKAYLKWEEGNPLEIKEKTGQHSLHVSKVHSTGKLSAVIRLHYFSEIWRVYLLFYTYFVSQFMAHTWTTSVGKHDEAMSILKAGKEANPSR